MHHSTHFPHVDPGLPPPIYQIGPLDRATAVAVLQAIRARLRVDLWPRLAATLRGPLITLYLTDSACSAHILSVALRHEGHRIADLPTQGRIWLHDEGVDRWCGLESPVRRSDDSTGAAAVSTPLPPEPTPIPPCQRCGRPNTDPVRNGGRVGRTCRTCWRRAISTGLLQRYALDAAAIAAAE